MCRLCAILTAGALALGAAGKAEAKIFAPPQGCTVYVTVQQRGCVVSNLYRCAQDNPGDQWRADFGQDGAFFVSKTDRETQWLESVDLGTGDHERLQSGAKAPASFSTLLSTGRNDFDFSTVNDAGVVRNYKGHDRLTGESVTIDGVTLKRTEYALTATGAGGEVLWKSSGHEYISDAWRTFLPGAGLWEQKGAKTPYDNTPVRLIRPGQPGFAETVPEYGCHDMMSELVLPEKGPKQ